MEHSILKDIAKGKNFYCLTSEYLYKTKRAMIGSGELFEIEYYDAQSKDLPFIESEIYMNDNSLIERMTSCNDLICWREYSKSNVYWDKNLNHWADSFKD